MNDGRPPLPDPGRYTKGVRITKWDILLLVALTVVAVASIVLTAT